MRANDALAKVEAERARVAAARGALETRASGVNPLFLVGGALLTGLVAGRVIGRVGLPKSLAPPTLLASALSRPVTGLLETIFAALLAPPSGGSKAGSPPGTQSPAP